MTDEGLATSARSEVPGTLAGISGLVCLAGKAVHGHLPRIPKPDLKQVSGMKGTELVKVARRHVQRCRHRKIKNGMGYLPEDLKGQVKAATMYFFAPS
jgi:hypothetical protein